MEREATRRTDPEATRAAAADRIALPHRAGPGRVVRLLSGALPGVRAVAGHIERYGEEWDRRSRAALASGVPLWFALGDSTAQGIGAETIEDGYVARLSEARPLPLRDVGLVNVSVSGARVRDVLREQIPLLHAHRDRIALVTCSIGSNDLLRTPNARRTGAALRELFDALAGLPLVAVATLPIGAVSTSGRLVNSTIRHEAAARGLVVADVASRYRPPYRDKVASDRFHPNGAGYADWAAAFVDALDW